MRLRIIQTGAPALKITPCGRFTRLWRCRSFSKSPCQLASASDKAGVHESDIANDRGCLSFFRLHNRREDVRPRTWYDTPTGCRNSRSEEHTSELQSLTNLVCRLLLEKKKNNQIQNQDAK